MGPRAVGVILSGTGSDGSRGIRAVHEAGGLVIVQSEESAKFDGMPRSAHRDGSRRPGVAAVGNGQGPGRLRRAPPALAVRNA